MEHGNLAPPGVKTRRRGALACVSCRQKKLRCDRQQPCTSCTRSKDIHNACFYTRELPSVPIPPARAARFRTPYTAAADGTALPTVIDETSPSSGTATAPERSLQHDSAPIEERQDNHSWYSSTVANILVVTPPSTDGLQTRTELDLATTEQSRRETAQQSGISHSLGDLSNPVSAVMVKTRYLSPSSWIYSVLLVPHNLAWLERTNQNKAECWQILQNCKLLSKRLKRQQTLQWIYGEYGRILPCRAMADILVGNYLRSFETIHRIVHVPSFQREYDRHWQDSSTTSIGFIIQVQLCSALGALLHADEFPLRPQVLQWIQEAEAWLESEAKPRLTLSTVQTMCLHRLARESTQGTYGDRVWILSGSLIRAAMSIGLHRDPTKLPGITRAHAEVRRRLWTTTLELTLSSCLDPGAAPLISLDDFDCALPSNFDDVQLNLDEEENPLPQSTAQYTDSSLQILLGHSLPVRLAIARFATGMRADSSQEVLRLSAEFSTACRSLSRSMQSLRPRMSEFQRQYCEVFMCRYIFTLHIPYMVVGPKSPIYMSSREACVDAAISLAHSCLPLASTQEPLLAAIQAMNMAQPQGHDFVRLCICGSGPYRSVVFQATMVMAAELLRTADEPKGTFRWPMGIGADSMPLCGNIRALQLLSLLRVAKDWTRRRMQAGQESNKDHLFVALAMASIEALMKGTSVKDAMETMATVACLETKAILEELTTSGSDGEQSEAQFGSEDDLLGDNDMWFIEPGILDIDFNMYGI